MKKLVRSITSQSMQLDLMRLLRTIQRQDKLR